MAVWTNGGIDKQLLQAAEKGNVDAQFNLGILYANGMRDDRYTVEGDRPEALRWLLAAAEQGLSRAQIRLAELYAGQSDDEPGGVADRITACGWFLLAMTSAHGAHLRTARSGYERAALHLTAPQIAEAALFFESRKEERRNDAALPPPREIAADRRAP